MMPIKTYKKIETIVLYFVIKKNLEISFQNGPEHETTSLTNTLETFVHTSCSTASSHVRAASICNYCFYTPRENFGLKVTPNQSDLFRFIPKSVFELICTRPSQSDKKFSILFNAN